MKKTPPRIKKFPASKQGRLDDLLEKNSEGTITSTEKTRLLQLVAAAEQLMVENAKRLAEFAANQPTVPLDAVPVTVWVKAESAGR